jgi:hypothetical protein
MARSNRSAEREVFWRGKFSEHQQSGLSVRQFCEREGLSQPSFYQWRRRLQGGDRQRSEITIGNELVPVTVLPADGTEAPIGHDARLEIVTPDGFRLRFDHDTPGDRVAMLLGAILRHQCEGAKSC